MHSFEGSVKFPQKHGCVAILEASKQLTAKKPLPPEYPKNLQTIGDHLRKRRLDLKLLQREVASKLGVDTLTICNWETNRSNPRLYLIPKVIEFLENDPFPGMAITMGERIKQYRRKQGLSIKKLAKILDIDPTTLARWERGTKKTRKKTLDRLNHLLSRHSSDVIVMC